MMLKRSNYIIFGIIVIWQSLSLSLCTTVKLYEDRAFSGLLIQQQIDTDNCITLPKHLQGAAGSIVTGTCILLFVGPNCTNMSIKIDQHENNGMYDLFDVKHNRDHNFGQKVSSFKRCSNEEGGDALNVDFYGGITIDEPAYQYYDICNCMNVPAKCGLVAPLHKLNNHGNCVMLYDDIDCKGTNFTLKGGISAESENIKRLSPNINSISPCGNYIERCVSLTAVATKFEFITTTANAFDKSKVAIAANTTFKNNGNAIVSQMYSAKKQINDTIEIYRVNTPSSFHDFKVSVGVTANTPADFSLIAKTKILSSLSESYLYKKDYSNSDIDKYTSTSRIDYEVQQKITILPCSEYEVVSYVNILENYSLQYAVEFEVTGKSRDNKPLDAEQLKKRLGCLDYIGTTHPDTVTARGFGHLVCNIGLESIISGEGKTISDCPAKFADSQCSI